ncbi:rbcL, partial [Symbiodinium pilosum]
ASAADGSISKVEYTFGYRKCEDGKVRICLHHSSLPYPGCAASAPPAATEVAASSAPAEMSFTSATPVAAAFVGSSVPEVHGGGGQVRHSIGFAYSVQKDAHVDLEFGNDVGYLPDGTPMNLAGNNINHPENIGPDPHAPGSPLPRAVFANDVGYLPDGTPLNKAGNAINHPETIGPDPHSPGSALPPSAYAADVGYLVDGTPIEAAGNNAVH